MKVSKIFKLGVSQHEIDFVDIDPKKDTRLFLDPHFLAHRQDRFCDEASATIKSFFGKFIQLVREGQLDSARRLFSYLHEPNETCLGLSKDRPKGNAVAETLADLLFDSLKSSRAVSTGLIEHIEDVRIFVPGIDKDKTSDMVTNIIRRQLAQYTREQCNLWDIPLTQDHHMGFSWDRQAEDWVPEVGDALVHRGQHLLLVPKGIVSQSKAYSAARFHRYGVLPFLQHRHLRMNSVLVQRTVSKKGKERTFVTKSSIVDAGEAPPDKNFLAQFAERHAAQLDKFKVDEAKLTGGSLPAWTFDSRNDIRDVAEALEQKLLSIPKGKSDADAFHKCAAGILELLFYPDLICPTVEAKTHGGRKRVDIRFENAASDGFFKRLHASQGIPCPYIWVECKNYTSDPHNPEVDQLQGRLSPNRGKVGLLVCRKVANFALLLQRCKDVYSDNATLLLPLQDSDLVAMLKEVNSDGSRPYEQILTERATAVRMG